MTIAPSLLPSLIKGSCCSTVTASSGFHWPTWALSIRARTDFTRSQRPARLRCHLARSDEVRSAANLERREENPKSRIICAGLKWSMRRCPSHSHQSLAATRSIVVRALGLAPTRHCYDNGHIRAGRRLLASLHHGARSIHSTPPPASILHHRFLSCPTETPPAPSERSSGAHCSLANSAAE